MLTGLSDTDSRALLEDRAGISGAAADRLLQVAAGNPLALLELPELVGTVPVAEGVEPLPVGPRVRQAFRTGSTGCRRRPGSRWVWSRPTASRGWPRRSTRSRCSGSSSTRCKPAEDEGLVIDRARPRRPAPPVAAFRRVPRALTARAARGARRARDRARTSE